MSEQPVKQSTAATWLSNELNAIRMALLFLTCIPVCAVAAGRSTVHAALAWYPLAGLLIGLGLLLPVVFLPQATNSLLLASLSLVFWVAITGALHLDGFADMADGWVGGLGSKERTLQIMKDPTAGPMAVVALVLLLLLKVASLNALITAGLAHYLWAVPVIGRLIILPAVLWCPAVSEKGLFAELKSRLNFTRCYWSVAIVLIGLAMFLPLLLLLGWLLVSFVVFMLWRAVVLKRLGGLNGDCVGALIELLELSLLLTLVFAGRALL